MYAIQYSLLLSFSYLLHRWWRLNIFFINTVRKVVPNWTCMLQYQYTVDNIYQWRMEQVVSNGIILQLSLSIIGRRPRFYYHHCNYQTLHLITYIQLGKAIPLFDLLPVTDPSSVEDETLIHSVGNIYGKKSNLEKVILAIHRPLLTPSICLWRRLVCITCPSFYYWCRQLHLLFHHPLVLRFQWYQNRRATHYQFQLQKILIQ